MFTRSEIVFGLCGDLHRCDAVDAVLDGKPSLCAKSVERRWCVPCSGNAQCRSAPLRAPRLIGIFPRYE